MAAPPGSTLRFASSHIVVRRQARAARLTLLAVGTFASGVVIALAFRALGAVALVATLVMNVLLIYARRVSSGGSGERGYLDVSDELVTVEAGGVRSSVPTRGLSAGWVVPGPNGAIVELVCANGDVIAAEVPSMEDGHAVLAAAGIDARRRAERILLGGRWDGIGYGIATVLFVLLQGTPMFMLLAVMLALGPAVTAALSIGLLTAALVVGSRVLGPAEITVGSDGVSWKRGFSKGFLAYRDLASVDVWHGDDIILRRRSGEPVLLTHSRRDPARTQGVVDMIRRAMMGAQGGVVGSLDALDRNGRSLDEWREALRAMTSARAYRDLALTRDDFARALSDPDATPERRMGAALALVSTGDADDRTRVRVAAEGCASDSLREALEGIARDEVSAAVVERAARRA